MNKDKINKIKIIPCISERIIIFDFLDYHNKNKYIKKLIKLIFEKFNHQNKILNPDKLYKISKISIDWLNLNIINLLLKNKIIMLLKKNKSIDNDVLNKIKKNNDEITLKKILSEVLLKYDIENKEDISKLLNFQLDLDLLDFTYYLENNNQFCIVKKNIIYNFLFDNNFNKKNKILLFSHKYFINYISDNKVLLDNCDLYNELIEIDKSNTKKKYIVTKLKKFTYNTNNNIDNNKFIFENIQKKINHILIR